MFHEETVCSSLKMEFCKIFVFTCLIVAAYSEPYQRSKMKYETLEDCEKELDTLFKESLGIEEEVIVERAHKVKTDKSKKDNKPRTIVCIILNYKDKVKVLRNAQKSER